MGRPPVRLIRGMLLVVIGAVLLASIGSYAVRRWRLQEARRNAPESLPAGVQQQTEKFTFSRSEGGRVLFRVEAARSIETESDTVVLEGVRVVVYGGRGERADEIRAARCDYDLVSVVIYCPGDVQISLRRVAGPGAVETDGGRFTIHTSGLRFEAANEEASTEEPVEFEWPQGKGRAVGLLYSGREPVLALQKDVSIEIARPTGGPLVVRGASLRYESRRRLIVLAPPLSVQFEGGQLRAGTFQVTLDDDFRTKSMEAGGRVFVRKRRGQQEWRIEAVRLVSDYLSGGRVERIRAIGAVEFSSRGPAGLRTVTAREATLRFNAADGRLYRVSAEGGAVFRSQSAEQEWEMRGELLEMEVPRAPTGARALRASRGGELRWILQDGSETGLQAEAIQVNVAQTQVRRVRASDNVRVLQSRPDQSSRAALSDHLLIEFNEAGELAQAELWGSVRLESGAWKADAGRARYRAAEAALVLEEKPALAGAASRTTAETFTWQEKEGTLHGRGGVQTTLESAAGITGGLGGTPAHLVAREVLVHLEQGWARYQREARLWQGVNRLEADSIELRREPQRLLATGNVRAMLTEGGAPPVSTNGAAGRTVEIRARRFSYQPPAGIALFEESVTVLSLRGTVQAPRLEVHLVSGAGSGSASVERVLATGGVRTEWGTSYILSDRVDYTVLAGTVVFAGGSPTFHDPDSGSTSASRLTLFLADDTILAESAEGTRTITRRPVGQ